MSTTVPASDSFLTLHNVSGQQYEAIVAALGGYRPLPRYEHGDLQLRRELDGVAWEDYQSFLAALGDSSLCHIYDQGHLLMMSPRKEHEWAKGLIARMIETLAYELDLPIQTVGSTTVSSVAAERGFQADEAYYFANEPKVAHKRQFDPDIDPPPDLVLEVDVTSDSRPRMQLFAKLRIPEVWRYDGDLVFYERTRQGRYRQAERSLVFPYLTPADFTRFLDQIDLLDERAVLKAFIKHAKRLAKQ